MLRNYLKIAWRNLLKNKTMFGINVLGLSIGIATCLTISLFVFDELSYDKFNEKADDIVRVVLQAKMGDELINEAAVMAPVAATFKQELAEVKNATRIYKLTDAANVKFGENKVRKGKMVFADPSLFDVFSINMLKGDAKTALKKPKSVVLTQEQAKTYFGSQDPINKTLEIKDIGIWAENGYNDMAGLYTVTGIIEKLPSNSHFHFDLLISMSSNPMAKSQSWMQGQYHTYLLLNKDTDLKLLQNKINSISEKFIGPQIQTTMGQSMAEFKAKGNNVGLVLQPLTNIHLHSNLRGDLEAGGDFKTVTIFGAVALFMLLIACINFMNLSTASASKRVKEIGMRKVLGSEKSQLIFQFLSEAFISTVFAMVVGILMFLAAMPFFNQLADKNIQVTELLQPTYLLAIVILTLAISLFSGAYPAFFMSSFKPLHALKNRFTSGSSKGVRNSLVVFQFAISATLIIGTLVVTQQMQYIHNKDIGYNRNSLIVMREAGFLGNKLDVYRDELQKDKRIKNITTSAYVPAGPTDSNMSGILKFDDSSQRLRIRVYNIDDTYIPTLGMKIVNGRNLDKTRDKETSNIIINETAIKFLGLPADPIGKTLSGPGDKNELLTVVGVVKDFNMRSLRDPIEPLMMNYRPYFGLILKAENQDIPGLLKNMETLWNNMGTGETFQYAFLDELYNETYLKESNMNLILRMFALLTIFVACLGLLGLITFTTEQRFKEIGIRKTLGSSVPQIVSLLSKDFLKLIAISLLIAFPLGYYTMNYWLQDFEYRIDISWWIFALAGFITVLIAFLTISSRSIKAALMNPVKSLKTE